MNREKFIELFRRAQNEMVDEYIVDKYYELFKDKAGETYESFQEFFPEIYNYESFLEGYVIAKRYQRFFSKELNTDEIFTNIELNALLEELSFNIIKEAKVNNVSHHKLAQAIVDNLSSNY